MGFFKSLRWVGVCVDPAQLRQLILLQTPLIMTYVRYRLLFLSGRSSRVFNADRVVALADGDSDVWEDVVGVRLVLNRIFTTFISR